MPRIRSDCFDLSLGRIESEGVEALILHPIRIVEAPLQLLSLSQKVSGCRNIAESFENLGHAQLCIVNVALQFADRYGLFHLRSIGVYDRIRCILPRKIDRKSV